jgi:hypothetical protein
VGMTSPAATRIPSAQSHLGRAVRRTESALPVVVSITLSAPRSFPVSGQTSTRGGRTPFSLVRGMMRCLFGHVQTIIVKVCVLRARYLTPNHGDNVPAHRWI